MRIYKMTATFGKLHNQTLTLQPGLNVIEAPNEWGKSTWCAFIVAMLYGISSSDRSKKDSLAAKEHYAPWNGAPMSGSMDICWNGRDITIERSTKGRAVFGEFQAYETKTGLPVPELTAQNCGQQLLGVEQGVFTRTGFLKLTDLPLTDDAALRARLNALVTTGDESGTEEKLSQTLKELKNRCRHNKTGLLPQAELQRNALQEKLSQIDDLTARQQDAAQREKALEENLRALHIHEETLAYEKAKQEQSLLLNAREELSRLHSQAENLSVRCTGLPTAEETRYKLASLGDLQQKWAFLQAKETPTAPTAPEVPAAFAGLSAAEAAEKAGADREAFEKGGKPAPYLLIAALCFLLAGVAFAFVNIVLLPLFGGLAILYFALYRKNATTEKEKQAAICRPYGALPPGQWTALAQAYLQAESAYKEAEKDYNGALAALEKEKAALTAAMESLTLGRTVSDCLAAWNDQLRLRQELEDVQKAYTQAKAHEGALSSVVKTLTPPENGDTLTYTEAETARYISEITGEIKLLQTRLGQYTGQISALGDRETVLRELTVVISRISRLEDYYCALTIAQETATEAAGELQRRFAPAISQNAGALFEKLTGSRYNRLILSDDFSVQVGTRDETALRGTLWPSDGTVDQLYLALRLAVARVLSPTAPLVLDDALVRFDDTRLSAALRILQEEAAQKQVLLFTCQNREKEILERM